MIVNLFSIFDPSSSFLSINWTAILLIYVILTPLNNSPNNSNMSNSGNVTFKTLINETSLLMGNNTSILYNNSNSFENVFPVALGIGIASINISALYPHLFPLSAQLAITIGLALIHWLWTAFLPSWGSNPSHTLSHLVPQGTPTPLINFIVLIELISSVIRPLTLCVRLTANIIAGHLLITLLGNLMQTLPNYTYPLALLIPTTLTILETAVAIIQSYVFMTLIALYIEETL